MPEVIDQKIINAALNAALIDVLAKELHYRYQRAIEQWNRDNPWWRAGWTKCPLSKELATFESKYSAAKTNDRAAAVILSARAFETFNPQSNSDFYTSVREIFLHRNILRLANANEQVKQEKISDPVVNACWDALKEYRVPAPSEQQAKISKTTAGAAPRQTVQNITTGQTLIQTFYSKIEGSRIDSH